MPDYTIKPHRSSRPPLRIIAPDASSLFTTIERIGCAGADVHQDERYAFTLVLDPCGFWSIFKHGQDNGQGNGRDHRGGRLAAA